MPRAIDDLLPEVLVYTPNAPEPVALRYIREAARKLCHDARLWRTTSTIQVTAPQSQGILTIADAEMVEIETARINGHDLEPVTVAWLDDKHPNWDNDTATTSAGRYITQLNPRTIAIYPRETGNCVMRMVLQPSKNCLTVPDVLVELHATTVGRGAAALLLMLPGVDFANPQLGLAISAEFDGKVASLKTEHTKGQQGARLRTRGDYF
jgi:hypothetical protein